MKFNEYLKQEEIEVYEHFKEYIDKEYGNLEIDKGLMDDIFYGYKNFDRFNEPFEWLEKSVIDADKWAKEEEKLIKSGLSEEQIEDEKELFMVFNSITVPTTERERIRHKQMVDTMITSILTDTAYTYETLSIPSIRNVYNAIKNELHIDAAFRIALEGDYRVIMSPIDSPRHFNMMHLIPLDNTAHVFFKYVEYDDDDDIDYI